jgi:hypothetical protein
LQRIVVLGDLLMASRPDDKSDRDIWRCRELKRSGAQIHAIASGYRSQFFALFDHGRGDLEILLAVVVTRASGYEAGIERGPDDERDVLLADGRKKKSSGPYRR